MSEDAQIATAKRTPGPSHTPWHSAGTIVRDSHDRDICMMDDRWPYNPKAGPIPIGIQKARAVLMSASPDMLEALKAQEDADEAAEGRYGFGVWTRLERKAKKMRRAAIAKAEGGTV